MNDWFRRFAERASALLGASGTFTVAVMLVLLWHPLATLLIGTWLSFVAVLILFLLLCVRPVRGDDFGWLLQAQLLLMLAMMPASSFFLITSACAWSAAICFWIWSSDLVIQVLVVRNEKPQG